MINSKNPFYCLKELDRLGVDPKRKKAEAGAENKSRKVEDLSQDFKKIYFVPIVYVL